jgi:O-6-methylguanine DNA methyltransferase
MLAQRIGRPAAVRAVGLANGSNPVGIVVPCHRVIGADGSLTGYGGGLDRKRWLLAHEGALAGGRDRLPGFAEMPRTETAGGQERRRSPKERSSSRVTRAPELRRLPGMAD